MTAIREWRIAIVNAVQSSFPVTDDWVAGYRRTADSKLALTSAAIVTDSDRSGFALLSGEFSKMQTLSDKYLAMRKKPHLHCPGLVGQRSIGSANLELRAWPIVDGREWSIRGRPRVSLIT